MNKRKNKNKFAQFFLGFLIPFVLINGTIFFLITTTPHIKILNDINATNDKEIKLEINSILPISKISITKDDTPIEYTKNGHTYYIPVSKNGTIKIEVTSINKMTVSTYVEVSSMDDTGPNINIEDATFAASTLTIGITDNDSGINYDNIYGLIDNEKVSPIFIDKSTGTIKFKINSGQSITIHVEDNNQNSSETTFEAG